MWHDASDNVHLKRNGCGSSIRKMGKRVFFMESSHIGLRLDVKGIPSQEKTFIIEEF